MDSQSVVECNVDVILDLKTHFVYIRNGSEYSRMDQVKFVENSI